METALGDNGVFVLLSWPGGSWQTTVRFVVAGLVTYYVALWAGMVWWTFRDSRERTRDPFMQALAVFLVLFFSFAGLVIYLMTRPRLTLADAYARTLEEEALLQELEDLRACPTCRRRVEDDFIVCPTCETHLKEPCSRCSRPLSYSWAACPYCATPRRPVTAARRAPAAVAVPRAAEPETDESYRRPQSGTTTTVQARRPAALSTDGDALTPTPAGPGG